MPCKVLSNKYMNKDNKELKSLQSVPVVQNAGQVT